MEISKRVRRKVKDWQNADVSDKLHDLAAWMRIAGHYSNANSLMVMCEELDASPPYVTAVQLEKERDPEDG